MCSFHRPRRRVPWSSGETTAFCFFATAGRSHTLKTSSSSRETFIVKPIRQLPAHRTTTSCPPTKSHSRLSRRSELHRRLYSSPRHTLPAFISCFYTDWHSEILDCTHLLSVTYQESCQQQPEHTCCSLKLKTAAPLCSNQHDFCQGQPAATVQFTAQPLQHAEKFSQVNPDVTV